MLQKLLAPKNIPLATVLAFSVIPITGLATDIYLPSMPHMAIDLHLKESQIQFTLTLFLISYGITQFFAGAIVDAFGRYKTSLISLLVFVLSFWITGHTTNIYMIYAMRILQGVLSGFAIVAKRAYFVDVYEDQRRKHFLSIMTIVWSLAPIIAPFIGGYLQATMGWQANFNVLAIYSALVFVCEMIFSGETIKVYKPLNFGYLVQEFKSMLQTADFSYGILMCGISYGLVMFYNLCGPFIIEHQMGHSSIVTGYVSLLMGLAWMVGGFLGRGFISKPFLPKLRVANYVQLLLIVVMLLGGWYVSNIYTLSLFAFLIHITAGFIFNNYFAFCLGRFPQSAGIAGGLTGGGAYIFTSALSYTSIALFHPNSQVGVSFGYGILAILGFVVLYVVKFKKVYNSLKK